MQTFRDLEDFQRRMNDLLSLLRSAILATDTREMGKYAGSAHGMAEDMKRDLDGLREAASEGNRWQQAMAGAAGNALRDGILSAQKVGLATNVEEMRAYVLDFKTSADFAAAYLRASLGYEEE
jgi:hypothetical protein